MQSQPQTTRRNPKTMVQNPSSMLSLSSVNKTICIKTTIHVEAERLSECMIEKGLRRFINQALITMIADAVETTIAVVIDSSPPANGRDGLLT